jgi:ABC-type transport system involved in multi-copper enzyme maturation permease subunit
MSRKSIKAGKPRPLTPGWQAPAELAPSLVRPDEPTLARLIGFSGLLLLTIGGVALLAQAVGWRSNVGPGWSIVLFMTGACGLLYHAAVDTDLQYRRIYGGFGFTWLTAGLVFSLLPVNETPGVLFLPYGFACFLLGLLFLLAFARQETDILWREATVRAVGGLGALLVVIGFTGSILASDFLLAKGLVQVLLGLCFLGAFVALEGVDGSRGWWTGVGLGAVGLLVFLVALGRSVLPQVLYPWGWLAERPAPYLVPDGLWLMGLGVVYVAVSVGIWSESQFVVLLRRELASFFYSPIAYVVLGGVALVGWYCYWRFLDRVIEISEKGPRIPEWNLLIEPVIWLYVSDFFTIFGLLFVVPVLTMRLLSEERRSGTLEVLFTAPVGEVPVVLAKFFGAFLLFLLAWLPWGLFLVVLRLEGERPFDYRPMLSFYITLAFTGASFISMGLFFSSLTRNQIASAVLTFLAMGLLTVVYFLKKQLDPNSGLAVFLTHISYLDLWVRSLDGTFIPSYLFFYLSATVFWLFLTTKVLEARKWI